MDRFMLKVLVDYPARDEERMIIDRMTGRSIPPVRPVIDLVDIARAREIVRQIYVDEKVKEYVLDIARETRHPPVDGPSDLRSLVSFGASPRHHDIRSGSGGGNDRLDHKQDTGPRRSAVDAHLGPRTQDKTDRDQYPPRGYGQLRGPVPRVLLKYGRSRPPW